MTHRAAFTELKLSELERLELQMLELPGTLSEQWCFVKIE
jgi:hypothetical protein